NIEARNPKQIQNSNDKNLKRFEHLDFEHSNIVSDFGIRISNLSINEHEHAILRYFYRYPEIVEQAAMHFAPNTLCDYLYELAQRFNAFYNSVPIVKVSSSEEKNDEEVRRFRVLLTE